MIGEIQYVNEPKGYSFIKRNDGGADVFGHVSQFAIQDEFGQHSLGRAVSFDIDKSTDRQGRDRAKNIRVIHSKAD